MEEKPTKLYFAREISLICSLTSLFGGVVHDVAVVVFLNFLTLNFKDHTANSPFQLPHIPCAETGGIS